MTAKLRPILFILLLAIMAGLTYALTYSKFSDDEHTRFQDNPMFWVGDTIDGVYRSNDQIAIIQSPVFTDLVITSAADFWRGSPYNPVFTGPDPIFNAPQLELPTHAIQIRLLAVRQGHFLFGGDSMKARIEVVNDSLKIWWASMSVPFDTASFVWYALPDSAVMFVDCHELHLFGTITTKLIIGASGTVLFEDNLIYASCNNRAHWINPNIEHTEKLGLVAEGDLKIQNTLANGRENSSVRNGSGSSQTNQNLTSIVLCGIFASLGGSFTFEQQNDPDSGYVCLPCGCDSTGRFGGPDDRGYIYLLGSIYQRQRGFVHRQSCTSTGYLKSIRFDQRLRNWTLPLFDAVENEFSLPAVDFGEVPLRHTVWQSVNFRNDYIPVTLDSVRSSWPFNAIIARDTAMWIQPIQVSFSPWVEGTFEDTIRIFNYSYYQWFSIPVRGVAVVSTATGAEDAPQVKSFALSAYPNPFNPTTEIEYTLPATGKVTVSVFDMLGQRVAVLQDGFLNAGSHRVEFDGQQLPSGIYFVRLESASVQRTLKLVLMK